MNPERVYGVDFSGAIVAGRKIWIAGGVIEGDTLHFDMCKSAATLPSSGRQRQRALLALQTFIQEHAPCVVGLDFPFGLPQELVKKDLWEEFASSFGSCNADVDAFRRECWEAAGDKELRRMTDTDAGTPFSPYNLRLYRQTYYGIRDVLAPLINSGVANVLPMQPANPGRAWLIEICPASTLKEMGLYQTYKNAKSDAVRDEILSALKRRMGIVVPDTIRDKILKDRDGDALDSVIAAVATFRALRDSIHCNDEGTPSLIEGFVYV